MGSTCNQCSEDSSPCQVQESDSSARITKHIKTNYSHQKISYFVTTEAIMRTRLDILVIFAQKLKGVMESGFIRELGTRDKVKLEERLRILSEKIKFCEIGDHLNIIEPFTSKCEVGNLLIIWMPILQGKKNNIRKVVSESFEEISTKCENFICPTVGIIEIDHRLGYSSMLFQKTIIKYLSEIYPQKRKGTFVYFTYTEQQIENFINSVVNPENSFTQNSFNSSSYF